MRIRHVEAFEHRVTGIPPYENVYAAAARLGWDRWIGPDGAFLGMHTFGASGPATDVYEHFGITADRAAELGRQVMEATGARAAG